MAAKTPQQPTVSLNKLAEFIGASAARRKAIVFEAKYPEDYRGARYVEPRKVICKYMTSGGDAQVVNRAIERLKAKVPIGTFQETEKKNGILALQQALDMVFPDIGNFEASPCEDQAYMEIEGVQVRVNPDLMLKHLSTHRVGAVKLHIVKGVRLKDEALGYVATVVRCYLEDTGRGIVDPKACHSIDLFSGRHVCAPKAFVKTMKDVRAQCEEFKLRWESL